MKPDEAEFLLAIANKLKDTYVRDIVQDFEDTGKLHHKRAWWILEKWSRKDWYDYGVTLDLGWLTEIGKSEARKIEYAKAIQTMVAVATLNYLAVSQEETGFEPLSPFKI